MVYAMTYNVWDIIYSIESEDQQNNDEFNYKSSL